jgi:hypothetical protein
VQLLGRKKCKFILTTSTSCYLYKCSHLYGWYFFHQCLFPLFWLFDIDSIVIRVYTVCERKSQGRKNKAAVSSITHLIDRRGVLFLTIVSVWLLLIGLFGVRSAAMNRLLNELRGPFKCQVLHWYTHHFSLLLYVQIYSLHLFLILISSVCFNTYFSKRKKDWTLKCFTFERLMQNTEIEFTFVCDVNVKNC